MTPSSAARSVRVLYVGAAGRSGSTLLDRLIGQLPGFVSCGELRVLATAGIRGNRLCGCGQPFGECPFWTAVGERAFGGWDTVDTDALHAAGDASYLATALALARHRSPRSAHPDLLGRLYAAISEVAGGATVIDSSKGPRYGALLSGVPGLDVRVVHLVRDPRGVAFSWGKHVTRPDVTDQSVEMMRMPAWGAAARWLVQNAVLELLGRAMPLTRSRYEDLLTAPRPELARILSDLGWAVQEDALRAITGSSVQLGADHTVMGNPMRMQQGPVRLRLDDAWRVSMPRQSRAVVSAMTWPMLVRYGYDLAPRRRGPRSEQRQPVDEGSEA